MNSKSNHTLKSGILRQLLYSEVFQHPLTAEELIKFSSVKASLSYEELHAALAELSDDGLIELHNNHAATSDIESKVLRRKVAGDRATQLFDKSIQVATFIQKFPFVEGVGISGSLSKGVLHDDGDFDYFIITKPGRVWIARTLLILYKKVFLLNSRKYFCVNYFIDSDHLEIEEKNRFTAVEIATLIPVCGEVFDSFYQQNDWVEGFFPNGAKSDFKTKKIGKTIVSKSLQSIYAGKFGDWSDRKAMRITLKRWKRKFSDFNSDKFDLTMKTRRYVSKHHPNDFQNKVLNKYADLKNDFRKKHENALKKHTIEL